MAQFKNIRSGQWVIKRKSASHILGKSVLNNLHVSNVFHDKILNLHFFVSNIEKSYLEQFGCLFNCMGVDKFVVLQNW